MNKLSHVKVAELLEEAGSTIRTQASYIESLETKVAGLEHGIRVSKLAHQMWEQGAPAGAGTPEELVANLREKTAHDLQRIEDALGLLGPDMGSKMGKLAGSDSSFGNGAATSDQSRSAVESLFSA